MIVLLNSLSVSRIIGIFCDRFSIQVIASSTQIQIPIIFEVIPMSFSLFYAIAKNISSMPWSEHSLWGNQTND
jgi:hypothetical protein